MTLQNKNKVPSLESTKANPIVVSFFQGYPIQDPKHMGAYDASSAAFSSAIKAQTMMKMEFDKHAFQTSIEVNETSYVALKVFLLLNAFPELREIVLWSNDSSWC